MMNTNSKPPADPNFDSILAALIEAQEKAGDQPVDLTSWTEKYPQYAEQIRSFFSHQGQLKAVIGPRGAIDPEAPTVGMESKPVPGQRVRYFGDYELIEEIARGGMGVVFKARQVSLNRVVALKMILSGHLAGASDVQRFKGEAEAAANLDHPHIVPIYEVGEHEGQHYFSMKLIEGSNLSHARAHRARSGDSKDQQRWAASLVARVAHAVHHAHQRGILHRDLKPGNILLDAIGEPHVTDFGLAKRVEGGSDLTNTGAIVGTPAYMAPEQARCEKGLSTAVDVYSLGGILYELLTGKPPFHGATPLDTILEVLEKEPPRPSSLNPAIDRDLETITLKCLEKEASKRYGSAEALAQELERWCRGEPIIARPVGRIERVHKFVKRKPMTAGLIASLAVLFLLLMVGGPFIAWREFNLRREVEESAVKADKAAKRELEALRTVEKTQQQVVTTEGQRDAQTLESLMKKCEVNLARVQAIRTREQKGSPAEVIELLKEAGGLRQPLLELASKLSKEDQARVEQFWKTTSPLLNEEAMRWLTESYLFPERTFKLSYSGSPPAYNPNVIISPAPPAPLHAISNDGKWIARQLVDSPRPPEQIQLIDAASGAIRQTITLPHEAVPDNPTKQVFKSPPTLWFKPDGQLLLAWVSRQINRPGTATSMVLHVETRSVPDGKLVKELDIDLVKALPAPENANIYPKPGPLALNIHQPRITFSADATRVAIMHRLMKEQMEGAWDLRPAAIFSLTDGQCLGTRALPRSYPLFVTPSGTTLFSATLEPSFDKRISTVDMIDIASGKAESLTSLPKGVSTLDSWSVSNDGQWLTIAQRHQVYVCHLPAKKWRSLIIQGSDRYQYEGPGTVAWTTIAAFHPQGKLLSVVSKKQIHLYRLPDLQLLAAHTHTESKNELPVYNETSWSPISLQFTAQDHLAFCLKPSTNQGANDEAAWHIWQYSESKPSTQVLETSFSIKSPSLIAGTRLAAVTFQQKNAGFASDFGVLDLARQQEVRYAASGNTGERNVQMPFEVWARHNSSYSDWLPPFGGNSYAGGNAYNWESIKSHRQGVAGITVFDSLGRYFLPSSQSERNKLLMVMETGTGKLLRTLEDITPYPNRGSRYCLIASDFNESKKQYTCSVYDIAMNEMIMSYQENRQEYDYVEGFYVNAVTKQVILNRSSGIQVRRIPDGQMIPLGPGALFRSGDGLQAPLIQGASIVLYQDGPSEKKPATSDPMKHVRKCRLIDLATGKVQHQFEGDPNDNLLKVILSADGKQLARIDSKWSNQSVTSSDLILWNAANGERPAVRLAFVEDWDRSQRMAFSENSQRLILTGKVKPNQEERVKKDATPEKTTDKQLNGWKALELWDVDTGKRLATSQESEGSLKDYVECPAGGALALWFQEDRSKSDTIRCEIWDLQTGKTRAVFPTMNVQGLLRNGKYFVGLTGDRTVKVIDAQSGKESFTADGQLEYIYEQGGVLATSTEGQLHLWHADDKKHIVLPVGREARKWFGANGLRLVSEDPKTGALTVWNTMDGKAVVTLDLREEQTLPGQPVGPGSQVQLSPSGTSLAIDHFGQIRLYDLATGKKVTAIPRLNHAHSIQGIAVSKDGTWIATAGGDRTVGIWDARNGQVLATLDGYPAPVNSVAFTDDGRLISRDESGHLACWALQASAQNPVKATFVWQRSGTPQARNQNTLLVLNERCACGNNDGTLTLYRLKDGSEEKVVRVAPGQAAVKSIAWHAPAQLLAVACSDGIVRLLDERTVAEKSQWNPEQRELSQVAFDPEGPHLFTVGQDIRYWDFSTKQLLQKFERSGKEPYGFALSVEGRWMISSSAETIRQLNMRDLQKQLKALGLGWD